MKATAIHNDIVLDNTSSSAIGGWVHSLIASLKQAYEERKLREHLASLDDALLRDIGIGEDEIGRIRAEERFTPRAWA